MRLTRLAAALMKGSLHTDDLLDEVVKRDTGLHTARRISQCFDMDVPGYAEALIITDAAVNIAPTLEEKIDIVADTASTSTSSSRRITHCTKETSAS